MEHLEEMKTPGLKDRLVSGIGMILCIIFSCLLICNVTIIVKGAMDPKTPPSVLGVTPMVVLSGSMSGTQDGHIEVGDLIFVGKAEPEELGVGDVITFKDGTVIVTHRILEVQTAEDGSIQWITKGDANNAADTHPIPEADLIGRYIMRLPKVGDFAMFLQEPLGMFLFVGVPILAFIIYDIIRRQKHANREKQIASELEAEIQRLKALAGETEQGTLAEKPMTDASGASEHPEKDPEETK